MFSPFKELYQVSGNFCIYQLDYRSLKVISSFGNKILNIDQINIKKENHLLSTIARNVDRIYHNSNEHKKDEEDRGNLKYIKIRHLNFLLCWLSIEIV